MSENKNSGVIDRREADAAALTLEHPERKRMRHLGVAEGISFLLLLGIAVPIKYIAGNPALVKILGPIHGVLFIVYVLAVFLAARVLRWGRWKIITALAAAVIPFGTFVLDAQLRKETETGG